MALLVVDKVSKIYGTHAAMSQVSFEVEAGHIVGLIGPNGAGKSTTMRAITGLMSYSSGTILFDGQPVTFSNHKALDKIGNLIEYPSIYPNLTAMDHLKLYAMDTKSHADLNTLMHQTKIDGDNFGNRKAKNFSLGMKQRLGIAIALIRNPKLVILDEPMNGLDPQSVHDLRELIRALADAGTAFLISSHLLDELQKLVDDVVIINHGKIIKTDTMANFFSHDKMRWIVDTDDNASALTVVQEHNWQAVIDNGHLQITGANSLQEVITTINQANFKIIAVNTITGNLEKVLLDILAADDMGK